MIFGLLNDTFPPQRLLTTKLEDEFPEGCGHSIHFGPMVVDIRSVQIFSGQEREG
jgi:hypothetical protein